MPDMAKNLPSAPVCLVKCLSCGELVRSFIQFGDAKSFFTSMASGNKMKCPECRGMTDCNKANLYFNDRHGNIVCGEDVAPEFVQHMFKPAAVADAVTPWLTDARARAAQSERLRCVAARLGGAGASRRTAERVSALAERGL